MKKKNIILIVVLVLVLLISLITILCVSRKVRLIQDSIMVEVGEELSLNPTYFFKLDDEKAGDVIFDISQVDTTKVGEYEAVATYKKRDYIIKVVVADTKAPQLTFGQRYIFTNDIMNCDLSAMVKEVKDYSEYDLTLVGFEKRGELAVLTESELAVLTENIGVDGEGLSKLPGEIPKEEGIYRAVVKAEDSEGNFILEEICLIYDTSAPVIADVEDKIIEQQDVTIEPEVDEEEYLVEDNVDGVITGENKTVSLFLKEEGTMTYAVEVIATDRAGNISKKEFTIRVLEKTEIVTNNEDGDTSNEEMPQNSPEDVPPGRSCFKHCYSWNRAGWTSLL